MRKPYGIQINYFGRPTIFLKESICCAVNAGLATVSMIIFLQITNCKNRNNQGYSEKEWNKSVTAPLKKPIDTSPGNERGSSMQRIFQIARKKAGTKKEISFHSLRYSFATHLFEKGVDIKYIKDLLGHFDIKTTARYLHVKREQLVNIESSLDSLMTKDEV